MTIETLTRAQLASELGSTDLEGNASARAIAQFMRDAMSRWGLCPKRALLKHAREQLRAGDVPTDSVPQVLERLVALGECMEVAIGHESYIAPAEPRWVASGGGLAVMLGPVDVPPEIPRLGTQEPTDVAVRVQVASEEQAAMLEACGARQISLAEWLHPLGYLRHVSRRSGDAIRGDRFTLAAFWEHLTAAVTEDGLQVDLDAEIRFAVGAPGGFFGRYSAATLEGRWRDSASDGVWCAYRRGYGDAHWLPTLVSVDGNDRRTFDLFDDDEWRWALLARSRAIGPEEVVQHSGDEVQVTWPLPQQLRAALDIVGVPSGRWQWRMTPDAPDLWALLN
ncbi:hypothetical protein [Roseococcus sp. YIM B11640]|uniref:hypothetical protein n=1 Tax=Roseococcus sp. YIM B11640 TaxID=3133973 RepID=UPI003C7BEDA1